MGALMSADRELLERAAKAIGARWDADAEQWDGPDVRFDWNPLDDDGDTFRLALAAHVSIEVMRDRVRVGGWQRMPSGKVSFATMTGAWLDKNDDERAALVRRMVVEAASRAVLPKDRT